MINRFKSLFKNVGYFSVSSFSIKLTAFLLLPFHTRVLGVSDFGIYDIFLVLLSFCMPIFTLSIYDAVLRFTMDKNSAEQVIKIALRILLIGVILLIFLFYPISIYFEMKSYYSLFILVFISQSLQRVFIEFLKGLGKINVVAIAGFTQSIFLLLLNYIFIVKLQFYLNGLFSAIFLSNIIAILICVISTNFKLFNFKKSIDIKLQKEMLKFSLPIIPNNISWWFNNFSSRLIIQKSLSFLEIGLYAAASRIPALITFLQGIFIQAWQYSVIEEYESKDRYNYYYEVYKIYTLTLILISSTLILFVDEISLILFGMDFAQSSNYIPFLILSVVFSALSGFIGQIFIATKETKVLFRSSMLGAVVNVGLNLIFTPVYGLYAASIISALSSCIIWRYRMSFCDKSFYESIKYSKILIHFIFIVFIFYSTFFNQLGFLLFLYLVIVFLSKDLFFKIFNLWNYIIK